MFLKKIKTGVFYSRAAVDEIELEIVSKGETREFANERSSGKVCSAAAKDADGNEVTVSLWNDEIDKVKDGTKIKIEKGWCSEFQGNKQVSAGKFGTLTVLE